MSIRGNDFFRGLRDGAYIGWDPFGTMCARINGYEYTTIGGVGAANTAKEFRPLYRISKIAGGILGISMNFATFGAIQAISFIGDAVDFHCYPWIDKITDLHRQTFD